MPGTTESDSQYPTLSPKNATREEAGDPPGRSFMCCVGRHPNLVHPGSEDRGAPCEGQTEVQEGPRKEQGVSPSCVPEAFLCRRTGSGPLSQLARVVPQAWLWSPGGAGLGVFCVTWHLAWGFQPEDPSMSHRVHGFKAKGGRAT